MPAVGWRDDCEVVTGALLGAASFWQPATRQIATVMTMTDAMTGDEERIARESRVETGDEGRVARESCVETDAARDVAVIERSARDEKLYAAVSPVMLNSG
jgi:hypothetical protein